MVLFVPGVPEKSICAAGKPAVSSVKGQGQLVYVSQR